jgi:mono/diheme cytochrome c family protein
VVLWAALAGASLAPQTYAQQTRTTQVPVFTLAQAARGATSYRARCSTCHGAVLEGAAAPALTGNAFLGVWGGRTLSELVDKVQRTMPADSPGSLSRAQAADLVALLLRSNRFPAGSAELGTDEASLQLITLPLSPQQAAKLAAGPGVANTVYPPVGNVNQLMRGILFPSSNVLFDVQTQDPGARKAGTRADATTTTSRYGDVYEPWAVVDAAAISLADVGPLLLVPGRRCENGKAAPVERDDWKRYVDELVTAGRAAYKASQSRSQAAVSDATNQVSDACANCHRVYRDVASAAMRCTPPTP